MPEVKRLNRLAKEPNTVKTDRVEIGNVEKGFAEADKVIEYTVTRARNSTAGVEAIACVAQWRDEFLDLWIHHQDIPQSVLTSSATYRDAPQPPIADWTKITVTMPYQGSWYGGFFMACLLRRFRPAGRHSRPESLRKTSEAAV